MDYTKLKVLVNNAEYSGKTDQEVADILNAKTATANVASVSGQDIFEAVVSAEYDALTAAQKSLLHAIVGMGTISVNGTNTKASLLAMFGAGTTTRSNLASLQKRACSLAEKNELGTVGDGHVKSARELIANG